MKKFDMQFLDIRSDQLVTDIYQRDLNPTRVKRIVSDWNVNLVNEPKVSHRDGKYYVFNGQHTVAAMVARNGGKPLMIRCKVFSGMTQYDEMELFIQQEGDNSSMVKIGDKLRARYRIGDPEALDIVNIVEKHGINYRFSGGARDNCIVCVKATEDAYKTLGKNLYDKMFAVLLSAFCGSKESFSSSMIKGMTTLLDTYKNEIDYKRLINCLKKKTAARILADASSSVANKGSVARTLMELYNSMRGGKKLPYRL